MKNNLLNFTKNSSFIEKNPSLMSYIMDTIGSGVIVSDPKQKGNPITYVNSSFLKITGYKNEEVINNDLFSVILSHSDHATKTELKELINNAQIINDKILNFKNNLDDIYTKFNFNPIYDSNNSILYFICVFEDTTEEVLLKKQNESALKTESDFLSNISHEIKTPLNSIIGIIDLIDNSDSNEIKEQYVTILKRNAGYLLNLIENMLNLSELQSGHGGLNNSLFNIYELLNQSVDDYKNKIAHKGVAFNYYFDNQIPKTLNGDSIKLKKIISCLINNSLNFTEKGHINFSVKLKERKENNKVCINFALSDTGIGIPEEQLNRICDFPIALCDFTGNECAPKPLSLALSKKLIDLLDGSIHIESHINAGTTISFDCNFESMPEKAQVYDGNETKKILIVEDSEDNRFLIHSYLKKTNCILEDAENGEIAYEKFKNDSYDLILMDIQMPVMDGYTATSLIREYEEKNSLPRTTIVALTAYSFKEDLEKATDAGCNFILMKPIKKTILLETLNDIFERCFAK